MIASSPSTYHCIRETSLSDTKRLKNEKLTVRFRLYQKLPPSAPYGWPNVSKLAILKAGRLQAESSRFQAGSSRFQAGSSRFQSGSSRFEARSSRFEAGSRSTRLSNVRIESIPNRIIECSNRVDFWIRFLAQIDSMLSLGTRYNKVYTPLSPP